MSDSDDGPSWSVMGNSTCIDWRNPAALWPYCPSFGAAVFMTILFFLVMSTHIVLAIKHRKAFCWVLIMGAAWEMVGFGLRSGATQFQQSMALFTNSTLFVLLAPLWINAFVYMLFARLVYCYDDTQKAVGIPATKLGVLFVCLDIVAFIVQAAGGSMLSGTDANTIKIGKNVYMAGIGFQESFLLLFTACVIIFHKRNGPAAAAKSEHFRKTIFVIYATLGLITARIIFRLVEYSQGFDSNIVHVEAPQYILDAVPMFIACALWTWYHPGRVLVGPNAKFPSRKEKKAAKRAAKADKEQFKAEKAEAKAFRKAYKKNGAIMLPGNNDSEDTLLQPPQAPAQPPRYYQQPPPPGGTGYMGYAENFESADDLEGQTSATAPWSHYPGHSAAGAYQAVPAADIGYVAPHPGQPRGYHHY